jgi:hypothetical protein
MLEILRERGLIHERAYVEHLAKSGKRVVEVDKESPTRSTKRSPRRAKARTSSSRFGSSTARGRDVQTFFLRVRRESVRR